MSDAAFEGLEPFVQSANEFLITSHVDPDGDAVGSSLGLKHALQDMGKTLEEQWQNEREYTTKVVRGAKAEEAFPEFLARKGR